jgi:hypothetical protein
MNMCAAYGVLDQQARNVSAVVNLVYARISKVVYVAFFDDRRNNF